MDNELKTEQIVAPGTLYVISAASGTGKSSLVQALVEAVADIKVSISHTTRPRRPGELDGVHYHFIDDAAFQVMLTEECFLEHAQVFDNCYGTSRTWIADTLQQGVDIILEIDWQGAQQIRAKIPGCVGIFILPPSREALESRLRSRNQDDEQTIARRMRDAVNEMSHYSEYDYVILNDHFDEALARLTAVVLANRQRTAVQADNLAPILTKLLS